MHLGLRSVTECGREPLLDCGVEWLIVLALASPVVMLVVMPERRL